MEEIKVSVQPTPVEKAPAEKKEKMVIEIRKLEKLETTVGRDAGAS